MNLTKRQAEFIFRVLEIEPRHCKHHVSGFLRIDYSRALLIHYSFGSGDIPPPVVHRIRKSLHLNMEEFTRLRDGNMTRAEYLSLVEDRVPIDRNY